MKLVFSTEEFALIQRGMTRLAQVRSKLPKKDQERGSTLLIKQMANKFAEEVTPQAEHETHLKRTHLRVLEEYLETVIKVLGRAKEEYEKKGDKPEYVAQTERTLEVTNGALNKVRGAL